MLDGSGGSAWKGLSSSEWLGGLRELLIESGLKLTPCRDLSSLD